MANHARRLHLSPNGHIQLSMLERFALLFNVHIKPRREGQMVPLLQFLGRLDGLENVFLTVPQSTVQADSAGHNMNMVVVRVAVPRH